MADLSDGEVIFYAMDADAAPLEQHLAEGGRAVFARNGAIILATGSIEEPLARLSRFRLTAATAPPAQAEAVLAAIAACWALDVPVDLMPAAIEHFEQELASAARSLDQKSA
jgi:cyanophycin synthetase